MRLWPGAGMAGGTGRGRKGRQGGRGERQRRDGRGGAGREAKEGTYRYKEDGRRGLAPCVRRRSGELFPGSSGPIKRVSASL